MIKRIISSLIGFAGDTSLAPLAEKIPRGGGVFSASGVGAQFLVGERF